MSREIPGSVRVGGYVLGLVAAFAAAYGVGQAVGPVDSEQASDHGGHAAEEPAADEPGANGQGHTDSGTEHAAATGPTDGVSGLTARADGFTLALAQPIVAAGRQDLTFQILTSSGRPLLDYTEAHEKDLHLIVVRRDLSGFQHVHPTLDTETGTWSVPVRLGGGTWRVIADFVPQGWDPLTLAEDLSVRGEFAPVPLPAMSQTATVGPYEVHLSGSTAPGADTTLTVHITRDGQEVTDLEGYLGAYGHLVALRSGDLGYLHVHPTDNGSSGPEIAFGTSFPTHGTYRLYLDFKHDGTVRTAEFTVDASGAPGTATEEGAGHDH